MARRFRSGNRGAPQTAAPGVPPPLVVRSVRRTGLRPTASLPARAKLFLLAASLGILGCLGFVSLRVLELDSRGLAILLIVLCCIGAVVITSAVITLTRMAYSLRAVPYLLGRGVRRMLFGRR